MVLDNEMQKELLLKIVLNTSINGSYSTAKEAVDLIDELVETIKTAEIRGSSK